MKNIKSVLVVMAISLLTGCATVGKGSYPVYALPTKVFVSESVIPASTKALGEYLIPDSQVYVQSPSKFVHEGFFGILTGAVEASNTKSKLNGAQGTVKVKFSNDVKEALVKQGDVYPSKLTLVSDKSSADVVIYPSANLNLDGEKVSVSYSLSVWYSGKRKHYSLSEAGSQSLNSILKDDGKYLSSQGKNEPVKNSV